MLADSTAMPFPAFISLADRQVLVVGAGEVAERKVALLLKCEARVCVVAPKLTARFQQWLIEGRVQHASDAFDDAQLDKVWLVVAATDDTIVNQAVSEAAARNRIWCNVVDQPALSSFIVPSIVDRAPLQVAISSGGTAPMLARRLREQIEALTDDGLGVMVHLLARYRSQIVETFADLAMRRRFYDDVLTGRPMELARMGQTDEAERSLLVALTATSGQPKGECLIVGAGPGGAEHLTLCGLRALNRADVILAGASVDAQILDKARRDAEQIQWSELDSPALPLSKVQKVIEMLEQDRCVVLLRPGDGIQDALARALIEQLRARALAVHVVAGVATATM